MWGNKRGEREAEREREREVEHHEMEGESMKGWLIERGLLARAVIEKEGERGGKRASE